MASLVQTIAVAEYLNFRHAANMLGVSQSSVSTRVKTLEEDLGIRLFERHTRGVRLTEAGGHFVKQVTACLDQLDQAVKTAGMVARGQHGHLRIGVNGLTSKSFLADLLFQYRNQNPSITLEIAKGTARGLIMQVRAGRLDMAFVIGSPEPPDCHSRRIWSEPILAALPVGHPLASRASIVWGDLAGKTVVVRHGGTGPHVHDHIILRLAETWSAPSILRFQVGQETLLSMVRQGFGVTIVEASAASIPSSEVIYLPFANEPEPLIFSAVWSSHNRSPALRNLLNLAGRMRRESGR
ncbi:LysR family transcriptional regulator [Haematobacter massiliensis]|uniref:LysR family transcriptional regulator n=3 Tax=Haematobacter massiliensis TaxID=195105 RepID=A0A086YC22_9RHOB|nr:LysR family transcriptional regulator [Haematobacter massiliensis]OWJ72424.1 LysR family transcriptional regulator [Haematobacter massiliensis]OWJ87779.1 LysR family transcriptional regulator [Haematobacter massiliensis]QBJ25325.1 LysR family transcriptional regulator [Haematobacter massiliensis]